MVICSEVEGNPGAGVTEAAEEIHASVMKSFRLSNPVWIEHHLSDLTDGRTETIELVVFTAFGIPSWRPIDRAAVRTLVGRSL